jgi:plasmid stabilization system protein ParE
MYKPVILPLAKQDIKEAAKWYNKRKEGLGKLFTTNVRKTVKFISQNPQGAAIRYNNARTILLETFPYMIHYIVDEEKQIIVIAAVLNTSRNPEAWQDRSQG